MSDTELKPCPFCGNECFDTYWSAVGYSISCTSCGVEITKNSESEAIEAWNRRNSGWVPVSKKKPEKSGIYLISFGESVRESLYDVMKNKWDSGLSCEPFAWMPMLKPYEVGK